MLSKIVLLKKLTIFFSVFEILKLRLSKLEFSSPRVTDLLKTLSFSSPKGNSLLKQVMQRNDRQETLKALLLSFGNAYNMF